MNNRKFLRLVLTILPFLLLINFYSCKDNKKLLTLKIKFECFPSTLVDSLSNVLLSNSYADLGGGITSNASNLFAAKRIYVKNLKRNSDSCFYMGSVEKRKYEYLYLEGFVDNGLFKAFKRKVDFSKTIGDTAEITVCFEPNVQVMSN